MQNINDLKCIKVTHTYEGKKDTQYISHNQFKKSFIYERWSGERRTKKEHTMFGHYHTRTTTTNPYSGSKSVRDFDFPHSQEQALERSRYLI